MRRLSLALLVVALALPFHDGGAQIIRSGRFSVRDPQLWISGGVALQQGWSLTDGTTGARWSFSDAPMYGGSFERTINGGTSVGVRAATGRVPLDYAPIAGTSTEADATVTQAFAGIHVASGRGFHSVLELGLGATIYSGFKSRAGAKLEPAKPDADFTFVFGYGFGYSFSRAFQIDVVQDLATALHQKEGLPAGAGRSTRISNTRLVARYGLGG